MLLSFLTIFLVAASLLAYEICLMRLLNIISFSHYAHMVVSLAMLGLGFSGVIIALFPRFFNRRRAHIILGGCFLFSGTLVILFHLNQKLPLNYLYLIWDARQFLYLGVSYLLYGLPFMILSVILALFFLEYPHKTGQVYAVNLLGSAGGVVMAVGMMYLLAPEKYLTMIGMTAAFAGLCWGMRPSPYDFKKGTTAILFAGTVLVNMIFAPSSLLAYISQYKGLAGLLRLPDTKIVQQMHHPLGLLHVVENKSIHLASGLSIHSQEKLPGQKALTIDADSPSAVMNIPQHWEDLKFFDEMISSAGYHLKKNPKVLLIGLGGGGDVLLARYQQAGSISVVEMNPKIIQAAGNVLKGIPFHLIQSEARWFLEQTRQKFDLIVFNPAGTPAAAASGIYAQNEDYLDTIEAYRLFTQTLAPDGLFMVSRWVKTPARDGLKLFFTGFEALRKAGARHPETHLALIRNWDIITLLVKKAPFTENELQVLRTFCEKRNFDVDYLPGIKPNEVNRFHKLPDPIYYAGARQIIDPLRQAEFAASYPFDIRPATDDRPYFSNFFRWAALPHLIKTLGREWIPFSEYGYLGLLMTLAQLILLGGVLILGPIGLLLKKHTTAFISFRSSIWFYFIALGFSYMVLEMALIQKFILFLHHPVYSSAVVIAAFLLFSGAGSFFSQRFGQKSLFRQMLPFGIIFVLGGLYALQLDFIFARLSWANLTVRLITAFLTVAPLAFFMGMPFPLGLQKIVPTGERNTAVAWGLNGFFSVIGAVVTPIGAGLMGFKWVTLIASAGYLIAMGLGISLRKQNHQDPRNHQQNS